MALLDNLVSYWKLDEAAGQRNDSHGTNHLTDNNTVTQAAGKLGNAAQFVTANSEFLSIPDNNSLDFTTAFTLSVWLYFDAFPRQTIASKWLYSSQSSWALESQSAINLALWIAAGVVDGGTGGRQCNPGFVASTWHHVIVVYDGSQSSEQDRVAFYIDGVFKANTNIGPTAASLPNSASDFDLGGGWYFGAVKFGGRMDAVGLWNRALTAGERTFLYNGGAGIDYPFSTILTAPVISQGVAAIAPVRTLGVRALAVPAISKSVAALAPARALGARILTVPVITKPVVVLAPSAAVPATGFLGSRVIHVRAESRIVRV
jgi:hypothetical protein